MTARLSLYRKAEEEIYKLDRTVKGLFYDFSHRFRENPDQPGLDLKKLKGDSRIYRAKINQSYRALLTPVGTDKGGVQSWLIIAVRHRKDVYDELQVAVNRVTGAIEFVDLSVVGDSALRRAGITLTPAEPDETPAAIPANTPEPVEPAQPPLLIAYDAEQLRELGVAEQLVDLALAVTTDAELDRLLDGAPLLSKDVLYGLAAGMSIDSVLEEVTKPVRLPETPDPADFATALTRTEVTSADDNVRQVLEEGNFRAWKVFLHPAQERIVHAPYKGPARISGGPGTGKTIVALHRVKHLAEHLPDEQTGKPILLTTYTANLAADLRQRLASLIDPSLMAHVEVTHIDQLAARIVGENTTQRGRRQRITDHAAQAELHQLLAELGETRWDTDFLYDEWDQVILGQAVASRSDYFQARRAGRGRPLTRPERSQIWKIFEQFAARLDKIGAETWGQAAERAAHYEMDRATRIARRAAGEASLDSSGAHPLAYRYRHIVVDEAQDLRAAHWKMLRAMAAPSPADLFITGDTHQRIYDHQVSLGSLGINIRGRSARLTLSYRTTREILAQAIRIAEGDKVTYDDLDDGTDDLAGYRSVLHGPPPTFTGYRTWDAELDALGTQLAAWWDELSIDETGAVRDAGGNIAVCVADRDRVNQVITHLSNRTTLTGAELTKDGPRGSGQIHVGTMHRFKGLEYQRLAIVAVSRGVIPRSAIDRYRRDDPQRYEREERKARALLFVAATRARDVLAVTWHGNASRLLPGNTG